jgi:hypothetical protein
MKVKNNFTSFYIYIYIYFFFQEINAEYTFCSLFNQLIMLKNFLKTFKLIILYCTYIFIIYLDYT